jgi:hypothetical protein
VAGINLLAALPMTRIVAARDAQTLRNWAGFGGLVCSSGNLFISPGDQRLAGYGV